ncbi:hypothetical protein RCL1_002625 [Eukaryota sp. TZLM3-RCL]
MSVTCYCNNEDGSSFGIIRVGSLTCYEVSGPGQISLRARIGAANIRYAAISGSPLSLVVITRDDDNVDNLYTEVLEIKGSQPVSTGTFSCKKEGVIGVQLMGTYLLICRTDTIEVYNLSNLRHYTSVHCHQTNVPVLACDHNSGHLIAFADPKKSGIVNILDLRTREVIRSFKAHNHSLVHLSFSPCGTQLSSASSRGTLVRVHNLSNLQVESLPSLSFRRGHVSAHVSTVIIQPPFLCIASDRETMHFFQLNSSSISSEVVDNEALSVDVSDGTRFPFYIRIPNSPAFAPRFVSISSFEQGNSDLLKQEVWICDHNATARCYSIPSKYTKSPEAIKLQDINVVAL